MGEARIDISNGGTGLGRGKEGDAQKLSVGDLRSSLAHGFSEEGCGAFLQ